MVVWVQTVLGPYGVYGLMVLAASSATFFPVTPDPLLVPLAIDQTVRYAVFLGVATSLASVTGGMIGYAIGDRFSPWVKKKYGGPRMDQVEAWYQRYGEWVVLVAGFSPLPFKVFTVTSGLLGLRFWVFVPFALVGRMMRFVPLAVVAALYGAQVLAWISRYELPLLFASVLIVGALWWYTRRQEAPAPSAGAGSR